MSELDKIRQVEAFWRTQSEQQRSELLTFPVKDAKANAVKYDREAELRAKRKNQTLVLLFLPCWKYNVAMHFLLQGFEGARPYRLTANPCTGPVDKVSEHMLHGMCTVHGGKAIMCRHPNSPDTCRKAEP